MRKYRPIRQCITVKISKQEFEKSAGGIIFVNETKEKESMAKEEGVILAMGEDMFPDSLPSNRPDVKIGDTVAFARYAGKQLVKEDADGCEIRVMLGKDILVVIEEE